jgi:hypothetical protein
MSNNLSENLIIYETGPTAHPASCTMGTGSFQGVKRPGRGADPSPLSGAEVWKQSSAMPLRTFVACRKG